VLVRTAVACGAIFLEARFIYNRNVKTRLQFVSVLELCFFVAVNTSSTRRPSILVPLMLTSARPPTRAWEVARTVVAPPSSVVKCLWEVFVWGFGVLFMSCVCVCQYRGCCSLSVCGLLIFLHVSLADEQRPPASRVEALYGARLRGLGPRGQRRADGDSGSGSAHSECPTRIYS